MTPIRRLVLDVVGASVGLIALVGLLSFLVDGVEQARGLSETAFRPWLSLVLARVSGQLAAVLPGAVALAAAGVMARWRDSGRLVAWQLCGGSPTRLVVAASAGALAVAVLGSGLREVVAPWSAPVLAGQGRWVAVSRGERLVMVRARQLLDDRAVDVEVAWLVDGQLVGGGSAAEARWSGDGWQLVDERGFRWSDGAASAEPLDLPEPSVWRALAVEPGVDASFGALWVAPSSPARTAWLAERGASVAGAGLLALVCGALALGSGRGLLLALGVAASWRLGHVAVVAVAARGLLPPVLGSAGAVLVLLPLAGWLLWRLERCPSPGR